MKKVLKKIQQIFDIRKPKKIIDTLFASFVVIILIPILILGILFTSLFSYHMSEQTKNNAGYTITYAGKILEEQLTSIHNAAYNMMLDQNIVSLEKNDRYSVEQMMAVSEAKTALQRIHAQNGGIDEIYLVYLQSGIVIAANQGNTSEKQILSLFDMESEDFYNFLSSSNGKFVAADIVSEQGQKRRSILYIKAVDRKRVSGDVYSIFFLNDVLIKDTMNLANTDNSGAVLLLDEEYNCLLCDNEKFSYSEEDRNSLISADKDSNEYPGVSIGGRAAYVLSENIALTKLKIFLVLDKLHYIKMLWPIWIVVLLVSLFIMLISVVIAKILSRKLYKPIGNIINMFKPDSNEYGEKSEIAFIDSKYEEIQTMKDKLSEHEATRVHNMRKMLLGNFLKGYVGDSTDFSQEMSNFDIHFDRNRYVIALIKVDRLSEIVKKIQMYHYQNFLMQNIFESLSQIYPHMKDRIYEFYDGEYIGILMCHNEEINLKKGIGILQKILKEKHDITVSVCISDEVSDSDSLVKAYKAVSRMMNQIRLFPYGYCISEAEYKAHKNTVDLEQYAKKLNLCIVNQKYDELGELIDSSLAGREVFYTEIIQLYTETAKVLASIASCRNCADSIFPESDVYPGDKLNDFASLTEFSEYLKNTCTDASNRLATISHNTNKAYEKIMDYINENYSLEIGLEDMAKAFGYSKNYFSRYFKELTGKNFVELLNGFRIEKAKELIQKDSNIKLLTVAKQVGFTNYRTFSAAFRKFEGQSPEDYRRNA